MAQSQANGIIDLNVGGVLYTTTLTTLTTESGSVLAGMFSGERSPAARDFKGRVFIDRDGVLFRYVLDFLRNKRLTLPDTFHERQRLCQEADFYGLPGLVRSLNETESSSGRSAGNFSTEGGPEGAESGYVVVGYRGTFAFGRDGMADVKFRKMFKILVSGRVSICREVFQDTLNESRDPDRGTSARYSARFFLKHAFIEQAFDALQDAGFRMVGSAASGTNHAGETKPGMDSEENKWNHYNEFVFCRP